MVIVNLVSDCCAVSLLTALKIGKRSASCGSHLSFWLQVTRLFIVVFAFLPFSQVQGQPLMVQVSGGQLITSTGQPIMVQAVPGGQGQTIMQVPVSGTQGLQQVR